VEFRKYALDWFDSFGGLFGGLPRSAFGNLIKCKDGFCIHNFVGPRGFVYGRPGRSNLGAISGSIAKYAAK
jgi:hypothetical protein